MAFVIPPVIQVQLPDNNKINSNNNIVSNVDLGSACPETYSC